MCVHRGAHSFTQAILNKLTPDNFPRLLEQLEQLLVVGIIATSAIVISLLFDKALLEPTYGELYAALCASLAEIREVSGPSGLGPAITFKSGMLSKCRAEFVKGGSAVAALRRLLEEVGGPAADAARRKVELELAIRAARRRRLGNIRFICELYKQRVETEEGLQECFARLLRLGSGGGAELEPDEEDLEAAFTLMATVGGQFDRAESAAVVDSYFARLELLSASLALCSRMRFALLDLIDLRARGWQARRKTEGPKKIEEIYKGAASEQRDKEFEARRWAAGGGERRGREGDGERSRVSFSAAVATTEVPPGPQAGPPVPESGALL